MGMPNANNNPAILYVWDKSIILLSFKYLKKAGALSSLQKSLSTLWEFTLGRTRALPLIISSLNLISTSYLGFVWVVRTKN